MSDHYQVDLPWRHVPPFLPKNHVAAEQRLYLLKRRLLRDPEFLTSYKAFINYYIQKGYAKKVPTLELHPEGQPLYLSAPSYRSASQKGKLRVVFDCTARYQAVPLNEQWMHSPDLTNSLFGVLERFHQKPVAMVSDTEAMFHLVKVDPKDYDTLGFLWWSDDDLSKQPIEYWIEVHLFGSTLFPSYASFSLQKTAQDHKGEFSHDIVNSVMKNLYVDNCLKSVMSASAATKDLRKDLCDLLSKEGFRLTKWLCKAFWTVSQGSKQHP